MNHNKVLLLVPRYKNSRYRPVLQAGAGYVAEALVDSGVEYRFLDLGFPDSAGKLDRILRAFKPDIVGLSMMTYRYRDHYRLAARIKQWAPRTLLCAGGPHAALFGRKVLDDCPAIDLVVRGEGERAFVELCRSADPSRIQGAAYRDGGMVRENGCADPVQNLDDLPFPTYRGFPLDSYIDRDFNILPLISSRGCPHRCSYCPVHQSMGRKFRARSAKHVLEELAYWYERGYRRFGFGDDNFTLDRERVIEICGQIQAQGLKGLKLSCDNGIRPDRVDREILQRMKAAGFWRIAFGVETGSDKILANIRKGLNRQVVEQAIRDACDIGFTVRLFFLIGSPGETWDDFMDSVRLAEKYPVFDASFYNVIPFPGTPLFEWVERNGRFMRPPADYLHDGTGRTNTPVFATDAFSFRQRKRAFALAGRASRSIATAAMKRKLKPAGLPGAVAARFYASALVRSLFERSWIRKPVIHALRPVFQVAVGSESKSGGRTPFQEHYCFCENPRVSVIIPSLDGHREGNVAKLIDDLRAQRYEAFEIHIVRYVSPQGKAINMGAERARGEILVIVDDDTRMDNPDVIGNLVATLDRDASIGLAGASILVPPDANRLQKRAAREFPRFGMPVVEKPTVSDMACHGCCALHAAVFDKVGREREDIIRGLDPDLRFRLRQAGYTTVLAANTWVYHPLPEKMTGLLRTFFRNGMGSAFCLRFHPDIVYETDEKLEMDGFRERRPFVVRLVRFPARLLKALFQFKVLRFAAYSAYSLGFCYGFVKYSFRKHRF